MCRLWKIDWPLSLKDEEEEEEKEKDEDKEREADRNLYSRREEWVKFWKCSFEQSETHL